MTAYCGNFYTKSVMNRKETWSPKHTSHMASKEGSSFNMMKIIMKRFSIHFHYEEIKNRNVFAFFNLLQKISYFIGRLCNFIHFLNIIFICYAFKKAFKVFSLKDKWWFSESLFWCILIDSFFQRENTFKINKISYVFMFCDWKLKRMEWEKKDSDNSIF